MTGNIIDSDGADNEYYQIGQGDGITVVPKCVDGLELIGVIAELDSEALRKATALSTEVASVSRFDKTFEQRQADIARLAQITGYREGLSAVLARIAIG